MVRIAVPEAPEGKLPSERAQVVRLNATPTRVRASPQASRMSARRRPATAAARRPGVLTNQERLLSCEARWHLSGDDAFGAGQAIMD